MPMTSHVRPLRAVLLALLLLASGLGCAANDKKTPVAADGVLDLADWDMARDGPVGLNGQWEFYWDRLLSPEDFRPGPAPPEPSGFMTLPGVWRNHTLHGRTLSGYGNASFRLRVSLPPGEHRLALRVLSVAGAYRLWVDGRLVAESGVVGEAAEAKTLQRGLVLARFESRADPVELVLQISNHVYYRGGVHQAIVLGLPEQLEQMHVRIWAWTMFFVGSLLIMAIYHFALYFLKKKDVSSLYFAFGCIVLITVFTTLDASDWLITLFVPNADPGVVSRIPLAAYAILASVLYRFYKSLYPDEFFVFIKYICDLRSVVFLFIILTQPDVVVYKYVQYLVWVTAFVNACFMIMLLLCLKHGRDGALILFIGYVILAVTSLSDIYRYFFGLNVLNLLPFGMLAFALSQALALAQRFANAFTAVENLSADLRAEIDERARLEREIVNVSEEERRRLSHDLHDGLCQQLAGTRVRCAVLARRPIAEPGVAAEVAELLTLLQDSVSQAYALSRGLWPVEHAPGEVEASLAELAQRMGQASGAQIRYVGTLSCARCRNEHLLQLYRIAQEAVTNAVKHARPARITITLQCGPDRRLTLAVHDDGIGRRAATRTTGGLGLRIMAYRARMIGATLSIDDAADGGTMVVCSLACQADTTKQEAIDG